MTARILCFVIAGSLLTLTACEEKPSPDAKPGTFDAITKSVTDAADKAKGAVNKKAEEGFAALRDAAANAAQKTLDEAASKIGLLKQKAVDASAEAKPAMESAIKSIEEQFAKVQAKIPEIKAATADTWKSISESLTKEGGTLMEMIKGAMQKFGVQ